MKSVDYEGLVEKNRRKEAINKDKIINLKTKMYDKIKPLQEQIKKIEKPFYEKMRVLEKESYKLSEDNKEYDNKIKKLAKMKLISQAQRNGKFDSEQLQAYLDIKKVSEFRYSWNAKIVEKKALKNGVQIFKVSEEDSWNEWFAFVGLKCIGFSYRRISEHAGDSSTPFSWIGIVDKENILKIEKETSWGSKQMKNKTFTEWRKQVEAIKQPIKVPEIKLTNKDVQVFVKEHKGMDW